MGNLIELQGALSLLNYQSFVGAGSAKQAAGVVSETSADSASVAPSPSAAITYKPPTSSSSLGATAQGQASQGGASGEYDGAMDPYLYSYLDSFVTENAMSSQQVSDIAYSGAAMPIDGPSYSETFQQTIESRYEGDQVGVATGQKMIDWVNQGRPPLKDEVLIGIDKFSDTQLIDSYKDEIAQCGSDAQTCQEIEAAFNNHTLTIENANQVQGLDCSTTFSGQYDGAGGTDCSILPSYNQAGLDQSADGKQHALMFFGLTYAYLSW